MKALSLTQPWASLVVSGKKQIETRSWATSYRGPLVIHAAKGYPPYAQRFAHGISFILPQDLPLGALIGRVELVDIKRTEEVAPLISETERDYGDYSAGRFAWIFEEAEAFANPEPYKGINIFDSVQGGAA